MIITLRCFITFCLFSIQGYYVKVLSALNLYTWVCWNDPTLLCCLLLVLVNFYRLASSLHMPLFPQRREQNRITVIYSLDFFLIKVIHGRTFYLKYLEEEIFVFNVFCLYTVLDYYGQVFLNSSQQLIFTKSPVEHCSREEVKASQARDALWPSG